MKVTQDDIISVITDANIPVDVNKLDSQKDLVKQGIDSLDMMNFFLALEEKFEVKIGEAEIESGEFATIQKIVEKIDEMLK